MEKALKILSDGTNDFEVHVLGDGNLRKKMEQFARKNGIIECMRFLGKIVPEQMLEEYQSAHLMVAPSLNEGMSIAALEALACGVYLIATRASGFQEMIQHDVNGNMVEFRDPDSLADSIYSYYQTKFTQNYKVPHEFLLNFSQNYSWNKINERYLAYLEKSV